MSVAGIIFSNLHDRNIAELTRTRTMASVPFLCRYRFVDFPLSNFVNSGITDIKVITHYNYQSLMEHIGSGKDWDLALRSGGIKILPPNMTAYANSIATPLYHSRLEALKSIQYTLRMTKHDYVILSDCDVICNMDVNDVLDEHIKNKADITIVAKKMDVTDKDGGHGVILEADKSGRLTNMIVHPKGYTGEKCVNMNVLVMSTKLLNSIVIDAISHNYSSFNTDVIQKNLDKMNIRIYEHKGYAATIGSIEEYYNISMDLLRHQEYRKELFTTPGRSIFTNVRNSPPTRYVGDISIKNSLIADGCTIEGTVENCILFRGVKIGKGAVVKNSVLFQDTYVGSNARVDSVIADKRVVFRDDVTCESTPEKPLYIDKGTMY